MQARAHDLDYTRHEGNLSCNYCVCTWIWPSFVSRQNSGLLRVVYVHQGPLISVVLALHIAKAEQRLCTLILIKVTVQLSLLFATRSNVEVKYMDIKGILYTNLPVTDFPRNDLGLMYEKIDPCWSICNRCLPLLSGGWVGQYCPPFRENVETFLKWIGRWQGEGRKWKDICQSGVLCALIGNIIASKTNRPI